MRLPLTLIAAGWTASAFGGQTLDITADRPAVVLVSSEAASPTAHTGGLSFDTVFKERDRFESLVARAEPFKSRPIGERVAAVGRAMCGTPYKGFTLEIDDRIEAPSVNFTGLDCWTFFETSLAFARMLDEPHDH